MAEDDDTGELLRRKKDEYVREAREQTEKWTDRTRRHVPPGLRLVLGILLIVAGILGFLPIVGFWMIPLGVAVAALDVRPAWRRLRSRCAADRDDRR